MFPVQPQLLIAIAVLFSALMCGTVVRFVALRGAALDVVKARTGSLKTWWILASLISLAALAGQPGVIMLLVVAAVLGLREFLGLIGWKSVGRPTAVVVFACVPVYFGLVICGLSEWLRQLAPIVFVILLGGLRAVLGQTESYMRTTAAVVWSLLLLVYGISHAVMVPEIQSTHVPSVGVVGWFLFLMLLTETNDIMQAITGRRLGRTRITPRVSPHKSLEGLLGGILATTLVGVISSPWLTGLTQGRSQVAGVAVSAAAGLLISVTGFLGDINMSGIKRDVGVKDGSRLLPGQGGMIDRIDSLTFTAPVFFYFVRLVS